MKIRMESDKKAEARRINNHHQLSCISEYHPIFVSVSKIVSCISRHRQSAPFFVFIT